MARSRYLTLRFEATHTENSRTSLDRELEKFVMRLAQNGYTVKPDQTVVHWEPPPVTADPEQTVCPVCLADREGEAIPASYAQLVLKRCEKHTPYGGLTSPHHIDPLPGEGGKKGRRFAKEKG